MINKVDSYELVCEEIVKTHLELNAIIQDIQNCRGPESFLKILNEDGRNKISLLRQKIKRLCELAEEERSKKKLVYLSEVEKCKEQLSSALSRFRKVTAESSLSIQTLAREELLSLRTEKPEQLLRKREKQNAANVARRTTDQLNSISRILADANLQSSETLSSLALSSESITSGSKELELQNQVIAQSSKLLDKYGRREITDMALNILGLTFFFAVVVYILYRRSF